MKSMARDYGKFIMIFSVIYWQSQGYCGKRLKELGITCGQFMYILCICENPGCSQEQVAESTYIDKSTVAKAIQQLLKAGYITRNVSPEDRRVNQLYPTEKAMEVYPKIVQTLKNYNAEYLRGLTDIERDIFMRLLEKMFTSLDL